MKYFVFIILTCLMGSLPTLADSESKPVFSAEVIAYYDCFNAKHEKDAYECMRNRFRSANSVDRKTLLSKTWQCRSTFKIGTAYQYHFIKFNKFGKELLRVGIVSNYDNKLYNLAPMAVIGNRVQTIYPEGWASHVWGPEETRGTQTTIRIGETGHIYLEGSVDPVKFEAALATTPSVSKEDFADDSIDPITSKDIKALIYFECLPRKKK